MNADGSAQTNLANNPADDFAPTWSPDGTRIAFFPVRDGNFEIYVMRADGSDLTRLTYDPAVDSFPAWSPAP
jgi:TolB protein